MLRVLALLTRESAYPLSTMVAFSCACGLAVGAGILLCYGVDLVVAATSTRNAVWPRRTPVPNCLGHDRRRGWTRGRA
ncbi:MAG: hypothetical protein HOV70_26795 [Streptomyces sp.]|nr:hypothetical protein [Streptomyces sp.]